MRYTAQAMVHHGGAQLSLTTHEDSSPVKATEYLAHWAHEMIKDGFVPEGALITYVVVSAAGEITSMVAYLHTYASDITVQ